MNTPVWLQPLLNLLLGRETHQRRHVLFVLLTLQPYAISVGVIQHSQHLGLLDARMATQLTLASVISFGFFYALVRSGLTQKLADPVLTYAHALACNVLCIAAYVVLGDLRANTVILIAQTIVLSMFRLKPAQVLSLGVITVGLLGSSILGLTLVDAERYPAPTGWAHFVVAGSTLLLLSLVAKWVSDIRVRIGRQAGELAEAIRTVQQMATTDMLTGLLNRRMLTELAETELKLTERTGSPLCLALIDVDHFKAVNDQFGHTAGDAVLKGLAEHATQQLRQVDKLGRWGGEEFLLMLPRVALPEAMAALERLRQGVEALRYKEHHALQVTFSAGVAQAQPGESLEHLVERADQALYEAKAQGRNRCQRALEHVQPPPALARTGTQVRP